MFKQKSKTPLDKTHEKSQKFQAISTVYLIQVILTLILFLSDIFDVDNIIGTFSSNQFYIHIVANFVAFVVIFIDKKLLSTDHHRLMGAKFIISIFALLSLFVFILKILFDANIISIDESTSWLSFCCIDINGTSESSPQTLPIPIPGVTVCYLETKISEFIEIILGIVMINKK